MILGNNLPNIPWQDRPAGCTDIIWRYDNNPIVGRHDIPSANSIFNSAVIPKDGAFVVVFRSDNKAMEQQLFLGLLREDRRVRRHRNRLRPARLLFGGPLLCDMVRSV